MLQLLLKYNQLVGFFRNIIKLTSVPWKLFYSSCWSCGRHCMKNSQSIWSLWSPLGQVHFDKCFCVETLSIPTSTSEKNSGDNMIICCWATCILFKFEVKLHVHVVQNGLYLRCVLCCGMYKIGLSCYWWINAKLR